VFGRVLGSSVLVAVVGDCVDKGELVVAYEYLRAPNWEAWEAVRAPRMACLVESVIVETGKVPCVLPFIDDGVSGPAPKLFSALSMC